MSLSLLDHLFAHSGNVPCLWLNQPSGTLSGLITPGNGPKRTSRLHRAVRCGSLVNVFPHDRFSQTILSGAALGCDDDAAKRWDLCFWCNIPMCDEWNEIKEAANIDHRGFLASIPMFISMCRSDSPPSDSHRIGEYVQKQDYNHTHGSRRT